MSETAEEAETAESGTASAAAETTGSGTAAAALLALSPPAAAAAAAAPLLGRRTHFRVGMSTHNTARYPHGRSHCT